MNVSDNDVDNIENEENENENVKLVELIRAGDKDTYEIIVQKYKNIIFSTVFTIVKNHHTAEDITQDTFLDGYLKINMLIDTRKIGVWLIKIAKNKCYNYLNRSTALQREVELDEFIPDTQYNAELITPENHFFDKYDRYVLEEIIKNLPDTHRNTTVMFYFKKYSRKKIAEVLDIPEGTVKRRLHDARVKLKREFELMADDKDYTPSAEFEKNIVRSVNNVSMVNIFKVTETGEMKEVKFGDIDNIADSRIEMMAPTESEIRDIARISNIDKSVLEAALYGEEVKDKNNINGAVLQFVSDAEKGEKLGIIFLGDSIITLSQNTSTAGSILKQGAKGIYELVRVRGYINLDPADVLMIMKGNNSAHVVIGHGKGDYKVDMAVQTILSSPDFEKFISKSEGVIINFTVSSDIKLDDIDNTMTILTGKLHNNVALIFAVSFDDTLDDELRLIVIAMDSEEPEYEICS